MILQPHHLTWWLYRVFRHALNGIARDTDLFAKKVKAKEIFGSNLLLGEKTVRVAEGDDQIHGEKSSQTAWAALRAAHGLALKKPKRFILVPRAGIEPTFPP